MKKIFTLLFLFILTNYSYSQCKFKKNEIDEFTKKRIRETKHVSVAGVFSQNYTIQLKQINENYYLNFGYGTMGIVSIVIGEGDDLMIKFENDTVLTLESLEIASANHNISQYGNSTGITCTYGITREQLEILSKYPASKFRFYISDGYMEKEAKSEGVEKLMMNAKCILN